MARSPAPAAPASSSARRRDVPAPPHSPRPASPIASWQMPSQDLFGLAQAFDQGGAQQERTRELWVLRCAAQLIVVLLPHGRVLFCQEPLVTDCLGLGVLQRDVAALPFVAIKLGLLG